MNAKFAFGPRLAGGINPARLGEDETLRPFGRILLWPRLGGANAKSGIIVNLEYFSES